MGSYYAFRIADWIVAVLPLRLCYLWARIMADIVYVLTPGRRRNVRNNMEHVLGATADRARVRQMMRAVFRNTARNYVDLVRLPRLRVDDLKEKVTAHGWHHLEDARARGRGVILATGHLGDFDLVAQYVLARLGKVMVLVEPLRPAQLFRHVTSLRQSQGLTLLPADTGGLKESLRSLRRGEVVIILCDRDIQGNGLRMEFFGEETTLPSGAIALALRTGAAVIPAFNVHGGDGCFELYIEPPLDVVDGGSHQTCIRANLQSLVGVMERYIRQYPEQWAVLEPVWQRPRSRQARRQLGEPTSAD